MINLATNSHLFQNLQAESGHAILNLPGRHIVSRGSMYYNGSLYIVFTVDIMIFNHLFY